MTIMTVMMMTMNNMITWGRKYVINNSHVYYVYRVKLSFSSFQAGFHVFFYLFSID